MICHSLICHAPICHFLTCHNFTSNISICYALSFISISFNTYIFISYFFSYYYNTSSYLNSLCFRASIAISLLKRRTHFTSIFTTISFPTIQVSFTLPFHYYVISYNSMFFTLTSLLSYHLQLKYFLFYHIYCQIIPDCANFLYLLNSIAIIINLTNYYFCHNFQYHQFLLLHHIILQQQ